MGEYSQYTCLKGQPEVWERDYIAQKTVQEYVLCRRGTTWYNYETMQVAEGRVHTLVAYKKGQFSPSFIQVYIHPVAMRISCVQCYCIDQEDVPIRIGGLEHYTHT